MVLSNYFYLMITQACVKIFFPTVKGLSSDIWSPFYPELKNTTHCVWSGLVFKMFQNISQVVHNNNTYSKACGLYLSQLIVGVSCLVKHIMLYVYLTKVYRSTR